MELGLESIARRLAALELEGEAWPDEERRSRIVFITRDLSRADIEATLPALRAEEGTMQPAELRAALRR